MKKNKVFLKVITCILSFGLVMGVLTTSVNAKETIKKEHIYSVEFDIKNSLGKEMKKVFTDDGVLTVTIEDVENEGKNIKPYYNENWGIGAFNKIVKANFEDTDGGGHSILAHMSARFEGLINPYVAQINKVSNGDFNATFVSPINGTEKYEILQRSTSPNQNPATARFRQKYSIKGFGQHDMCLYLYVSAGGLVRIDMQGIW